jgi:hypothetical protein
MVASITLVLASEPSAQQEMALDHYNPGDGRTEDTEMGA